MGKDVLLGLEWSEEPVQMQRPKTPGAEIRTETGLSIRHADAEALAPVRPHATRLLRHGHAPPEVRHALLADRRAPRQGKTTAALDNPDDGRLRRVYKHDLPLRPLC